MGKPLDEEYFKDVFKKAAEIANVVPENMREAAFHRAVDALLSQTSQETRRSHKASKHKAVARGVDGVPGTIGDLMKIMDRTQHPEIGRATKVLDRSLYLLRAVKTQHGIDGLTPSEIARILTDKFRVSTKDSAVRMALGGAGNLVDRVPRGKGYAYRIMEAGEIYLEGLDKKTPADLAELATGSRRKKSKKGRSEIVRSGQTSSVKRVPKSSRPGPKQIILDLIAEGFFDTARSMKAIISYLEQKLGYRYKATDLSPALVRLTRDKKLDRERNSGGQYEYSKH
ncbi:MAG: hypothetical protein AB1507_09115 [Bacillota bacterium]